MTTLISGTIKTLALCFVALVCLTLTQVEVRADQVNVQGSTSGTFTSTGTNTLNGLTFTNGSFNVTTVGGFAAIGASAGSTNNLGTFTLNNTPASYTGQTFTLTVTFTAPAGITMGNPAMVSATLTGTVEATAGGVFIDFDDVPVLVTFNNGTTAGSFSLTVNNVSLDGGNSIAVSGNITGAQANTIPEPATLILLGTGLTGVAARIRKRRKNANAASIS